MTARQLPGGLGQARQRWRAMPSRERQLVAIAVAVLLAALVWWIAVGPAIATLATAPARQQALDAQLMRMRAMQQQAQALKGQPRKSFEEAARALEAATQQQFGSQGRLTVAGERATAALAGVRGEALARWLSQARINAGALPVEARLNRNAAGAWEGTVVLSLPPRG